MTYYDILCVLQNSVEQINNKRTFSPLWTQILEEVTQPLIDKVDCFNISKSQFTMGSKVMAFKDKTKFVLLRQEITNNKKQFTNISNENHRKLLTSTPPPPPPPKPRRLIPLHHVKKKKERLLPNYSKRGESHQIYHNLQTNDCIIPFSIRSTIS